jgi:hypothetical protein
MAPEETDAWVAEQTARYMEAKDKEHAEVVARIDEAARKPPTDGEKIYAIGEAECLCHNDPPCRLCEVLTEVEIDVVAKGGLGLLLAFWDDVEDRRQLIMEIE